MLSRKTVSILVALFFSVSIVAPSLAILVGHNDNLICIIDAKDLESQEKEPLNDKENKILNAFGSELSLLDYKSLILGEYCLHNYSTPHLILFLPPPEAVA